MTAFMQFIVWLLNPASNSISCNNCDAGDTTASVKAVVHRHAACVLHAIQCVVVIIMCLMKCHDMFDANYELSSELPSDDDSFQRPHLRAVVIDL